MLVYFAQAQPAPQDFPGLQRQSLPQRQAGLQPQPVFPSLAKKVLSASIIVGLRELAIGSVRKDKRIPMPAAHRPLERNGYDISSDAAGIPNMRLKVRLIWAESAKPAAWAASVRLSPPVCASTARIRRSHCT